MNSIKLSVIILTKNEEKNIERCLNSVRHADEIVVIDDNSEDETVDIAKRYGAKTFQKKLGDFASQRNFGLDKAQGRWILFIDADEELTTQLVTEINSAINNDNNDSFFIKRRDFFMGKEIKHGDVKSARERGFIRLVKRGSGKWVGNVHEVYQPNVGAHRDAPLLKSFINHYPHPTIKEFLSEVNFYSTMRAKELYSSKKTVNIIEIIFVPFAKFFWNYFIRLGVLDGPEGFIYAFFMSFHSFLVRAKLYQYKNYPKY
ncbi:MAG: glycosyltransferase family 2 protein [Candidatus Roizmanbacteria bacterium]|nr:MAG: glycosyltransferase family 2 protein [Candidatus Roizmanbacteria bacterium]